MRNYVKSGLQVLFLVVSYGGSKQTLQYERHISKSMLLSLNFMN